MRKYNFRMYKEWILEKVIFKWVKCLGIVGIILSCVMILGVLGRSDMESSLSIVEGTMTNKDILRMIIISILLCCVSSVGVWFSSYILEILDERIMKFESKLVTYKN